MTFKLVTVGTLDPLIHVFLGLVYEWFKLVHKAL